MKTPFEILLIFCLEKSDLPPTKELMYLFDDYYNMSAVSFEKDIALDLINTKLSQIKNEISLILNKWDQESAEQFVEDTRKGKIEEAEHDAIVMTNLLSEKEKFEKLLIEIE